eukprot:PhF_6_TR10625/c0_g1_i1/m.17209
MTDFGSLEVTVVEAKDLPNLDKGLMHSNSDLTDAYVSVSCPGVSKTSAQKTSVVKDSLDPKWNQTFQFQLIGPIANNPQAKLMFRVYDQDPVKDDELGAYPLNLQEIAASKLFDDWVSIGTTGGKLRIRVKFTPPPASSGAGSGGGTVAAAAAGAMNLIAGASSSGGGQPQSLGVALSAAERPNPKGEWVLRVTIHEARGLQGDGIDSLDPVVKIRAGSIKRTTAVVKDTFSPAFNEDFTLKFSKNAPESFWETPLTLEVYHSKVFVDACIGGFTFEFGTIYDQPGHEYFRRWIVLQKGGGDEAVMGYLLVSVALLGPNDDLVPHDVEIQETDTLANCLYPKATVFQTIELLVTVYRAEDIPQMDFSFVSGIKILDSLTGQKNKQCADPFVAVSFAGNEVRSDTIESSQYPEFFQTLHLPVVIPSMSKEIRIRLVDYDVATENDVIGTVCLNLDELTSNGKHMPRLSPTWLTMYGAPRNFSMKPNIPTMRYYERQNQGLVPGGSYRARLLVGVESIVAPKPVTLATRAMAELPSLPIADYNLLVEMMWGSMFQSASLRMVASWGDNHVGTRFVKASAVYSQPGTSSLHNSCAWYERLEFKQPWEVDAYPDLLLMLVDSSDDRLAYARVALKELVGKGPVEKTLFLVPHSDPSDSDGTIAGLVGFRVTLTHAPPRNSITRLPPNPAPKKDIVVTQGVPMTIHGAKQMIVRAHIYKAKQLPPGDDSGLSDPYFRIIYGSGCGQTTFLCNTLNPSVNECVEFEADVFQPFPPLIVEAWDFDLVGKNTFLGRFTTTLSATKSPPPLEWFPLNKGGEVLASFELIPKGSGEPLPPATRRKRINPPSIVADSFSAIPISPSIAPVLYEAIVDVECVGLRQMASYMMLDIKDALIEFSVDDIIVCSKRTRGLNANFLEKVSLNVSLPEDIKFVPALSIKVYDHRFFGQRVLVASTSVSLADVMNGNLMDSDADDDCEHLRETDDFDRKIIEKDLALKCSSPVTSPSNVQINNSYGTMTTLDNPNSGLNEPDDDDTISKWLKMYFKGMIPRYPNTLEKQLGGFRDRFQCIPLHRGVAGKTVGYFKGCIEVRRISEPPHIPASSLLTESSVVIRVYILRASSLIPHDSAIMGGKNDPYLKISLGNGLSYGSKPLLVQTTEDRPVYGTLDPEFMEYFEFDAKIPTVNELEIAIYDYDTIGSNELIGSTIIDLEDRWFTLKRDLIPTERHTERRPIFHQEQSGGTAQGRVEMWIDIFDKSKGNVPPPVDIKLPPNEGYELRVVVWNLSNCILQESATMTSEMMSDLYVKCYLEGKKSDQQDTDVHYRSLDGSGAFNWRMKFPLMYVRRDKGILLNTESTQKFKLFSHRQQQKPVKPNLVVQIWENDIVSPDDFLGELKIPLDKRPPPSQNIGKGFLPSTALSLQALNLFGKVGDPQDSTRTTINGLQPTQKIWYRVPDKDGKLAGEVQLSFQLVPLNDAEKPDLEAGKGRSEPNKNPFLPPPQRPETSFFWMTSPLKTMYHIIWKHYKYWIIGAVCLALILLLLYGFGVYTVQVGTYKMWGVNVGGGSS